jgi:hypothetical protein
MANEAEINREDIISKEAIEAPLVLIKNLQKLVEGFDDTIVKAQKHHKAIGDTTSIKKLSGEIEKLLAENKKLMHGQDDLLKRVDKLEKENKDLAKSLKQVQDETKKTRQEQEKLSNAMEALDNRIGGNISRWKQLGKELFAIVKHPIVLTLAVIIGLLAAATSAVKTFWSSTGEGEDIAARQASTWRQFFNVLKTGWADLGKAIQDFFGEGGSDMAINLIFEGLKIMFPFLSAWLVKLQTDFNRTSAEAKKMADVVDDIQTRMAINIEKSARTQRDANKLLLESQDDLMHTDLDRLVLLTRYNDLKKEQLDIDLSIARDNAKATLYLIGLEHNLTKAQVDRMTFAEMDAKFTGEQIKRIMQSRADVIDLEATYYQEVKKNSAKILHLREEMHKKEVELAKKAAVEIVQLGRDAVEERQGELAQRIAGIQAQVTKEIQNESLGWRKRKEIIENAEADIAEIKKQARIQEIEDSIKALEVSFKLLEFDKETQEKVAKEIAALKLKLIEEVYKTEVAVGKTQLQKDIENLNILKEHYEAFAGSISEIFQNVSQSRLDNIDREQEALERQFDTEMRMAGDNDERKKEIENEADKRRRDLEVKRIKEQRRAAIFDKVTSLIQAGINGALAVTNQLAKGDPYTAFARAAAAGIAAGIQVIAIASKQIPQYFKGGYTKVRRIMAGELGFEHFTTPEGKEGFTPNTATVMDLPVGTKIDSHEDTLADIAKKSIRPEKLGGKVDVEFLSMVGQKIDNLNHTIATKPVVQVNYTPNGVEGLLIKAINKIKFNRDLFR